MNMKFNPCQSFDPYAIYREGKRIELTEEEVIDIYFIKQREFRFRDAEDHLRDYMKVEEQCGRQFFVSADELCDPKSEHYILDIAVERYEHAHDCNCAENDMWEAICSDLLEGYEI